MEDQIKELSKFGLSAIALAQVLDERTKHDIYNINANTSIIIGSAERSLNEEFINILKDRDSQLYQRLSLVVVDDCHTVSVKVNIQFNIFETNVCLVYYYESSHILTKCPQCGIRQQLPGKGVDITGSHDLSKY